MDYVSLQRAKDHLAMDHDEDDSLISAYITAASSAVRNYLKSASPFELVRDENGAVILDSNGDPEFEIDSHGARVPRLEVQQATLILIGYFYRDRDGNSDGAYQHGYLPMPVTALLYPLRDPAVA